MVSMEDLKKLIEGLNTNLKEYRKECQAFQRQMSDHVDKKLESIMRIMNSKTVFISGLPEKPNETYAQLDKAIEDLGKSLNINHLDYDNVRRLGKPEVNKTRIVKLTLLRERDKFTIFNNKKNVRNKTKYKDLYINPARTKVEADLNKKMIEKAKELVAGEPGTTWTVRGIYIKTELNGRKSTYKLSDEDMLEVVPNRGN